MTPLRPSDRALIEAIAGRRGNRRATLTHAAVLFVSLVAALLLPLLPLPPSGFIGCAVGTIIGGLFGRSLVRLTVSALENDA